MMMAQSDFAQTEGGFVMLIDESNAQNWAHKSNYMSDNGRRTCDVCGRRTMAGQVCIIADCYGVFAANSASNNRGKRDISASVV